MRFAIIFAILTSHYALHAQTLKPSSFICENEQSVLLPKQDKWKDLSGPGAMKSIAASIEFSKMMIRSQTILGDLSATEERIRRESRYGRGSNSVQHSESMDEKRKHENNLSNYDKMSISCADSGASAIQADVIESRPISGISKVRIPMAGSSAEVWTYSSNISP